MHVTFGGDVADPEALLLAVGEHVNDVAAVGRDGYASGFAAVGEFGDLHVLQIQGVGAREKFVTGEGDDGQDYERCDQDWNSEAVPWCDLLRRADVAAGLRVRGDSGARA